MQTYTKKEIARLTNCSVSTIRDDIEYLKFKPEDSEDYGTNVYSEAQFQVIKSLRKHCAQKGKTRSTFIAPIPTEIVEQPLQKIIPKPPSITDITKQSIQNQLAIDPFYDLELLQRLVDNRWLLPTKRLAAIINISPSTLVRENNYKYCGYLIIRTNHVGDKNGSWLWSVTRR